MRDTFSIKLDKALRKLDETAERLRGRSLERAIWATRLTGGEGIKDTVLTWTTQEAAVAYVAKMRSAGHECYMWQLPH